MSYTHSFSDVTPPARYDTLPWTRVRVEEAALAAGPFTQIADLVVAVDPSPESPNPVDVTATTATIDAGYFRFRFQDAAGTLSPYTTPVYSPSELAADLSISELKLYLGKERDTDDTFLQAILDGAVAFAQRYTGRTFTRDPVDDDATATRTVTAGAGRSLVQIPDAREITAVTVNGDTVTDWVTSGTPLSFLRLADVVSGDSEVVLTGRFGFSPLPADLRDAIYVHAARRFHERSANYADSVAPLEDGAVQSYFRMLPANVKAVYESYRMPAVV